MVTARRARGVVPDVETRAWPPPDRVEAPDRAGVRVGVDRVGVERLAVDRGEAERLEDADRLGVERVEDPDRVEVERRR